MSFMQTNSGVYTVSLFNTGATVYLELIPIWNMFLHYNGVEFWTRTNK